VDECKPLFRGMAPATVSEEEMVEREREEVRAQRLHNEVGRCSLTLSNPS